MLYTVTSELELCYICICTAHNVVADRKRNYVLIILYMVLYNYNHYNIIYDKYMR